MSDPRPGPNTHGLMGGKLNTDRQIWVLVSVAGIRHQDVLSEPHVVTDDDRLVGGERAAGADHTAVADYQSVDVVAMVLARVADGQRAVSPNHRVLADPDLAFAKNGGDGKPDRAARAELGEQVTLRGARNDRAH